MGKASSNKKVARAASTSGGRTAGGRTPWGYYLVILAMVVLGTALVYVSRNNRLKVANTVGPTPPAVATNSQIYHWHEAYALYVCTGATTGRYVPPFPFQFDAAGILTMGNGVIDIHPYEKSAAGKNAVIGVFTAATHVGLNAGELNVPSIPSVAGVPGFSGHIYHDSDSCGGKPGHVQVATFATATTTVGKLWTKDPRLVPLADQSMITIAFVPKGTQIPPPPQAIIDAMVHPDDVPVTSNSAATTTTVPGATTTAPKTTTTTVAPAATTTVPQATTAINSTTTTPVASGTTSTTVK